MIATTLYHYVMYRTLLAFRTGNDRFECSRVRTRKWCKSLCRVAGFAIHVEGPELPRPCLVAPNHHGYVDVMALGAALDVFFLSKAEVADWPVAGKVFRDSLHLQVKRERRDALAGAVETVADRLRAGFSVVVFLEGTSSGGDGTLPFRSALVQAAIDAQKPIVPVGVRWTSPDPRIDVAEDVAYWGGHVIGPHVWRLLGLRNIHVTIRIGDPVDPAGYSRKELAARVQDEVAMLAGYTERSIPVTIEP